MSSHGLDGSLPLPQLHSVHITNANNNHNDDNNTQRVVAQQMLALNDARERAFVTGYSNNDSSESSSAMQSQSDTGESSDNPVVSIINISNNIDVEQHNDIIFTTVKHCIRQKIWVNNKFLTDHTMKNMTITNRNNPNSILNLLLFSTRKTNLSDAHRFRFWKKYGIVVQKELNLLKTLCARGIKKQLMRGKSL